LKQGVEVWNAWREQNKNITPELSNADLDNADLTGADLFRADLTAATLTGATLTRATLFGATLTRATLFGATLTKATLFGATLTAPNLSIAVLFYTVFGDTDLTAVQGLETCRHGGPSVLDHRTIAGSWPLPPAFLWGCGLPDTLIDY